MGGSFSNTILYIIKAVHKPGPHMARRRKSKPSGLEFVDEHTLHDHVTEMILSISYRGLLNMCFWCQNDYFCFNLSFRCVPLYGKTLKMHLDMFAQVSRRMT